MSKADKWFNRNRQVKEKVFCSNTILKDFERDENGKVKVDQHGNGEPIFDYCGKKMAQKKLKNYIRYTCPYCRAQKLVPKTRKSIIVGEASNGN